MIRKKTRTVARFFRRGTRSPRPQMERHHGRAPVRPGVYVPALRAPSDPECASAFPTPEERRPTARPVTGGRTDKDRLGKGDSLWQAPFFCPPRVAERGDAGGFAGPPGAGMRDYLP